eukprot:5345193-Alexandrium_andersonii.AAC.1
MGWSASKHVLLDIWRWPAHYKNRVRAGAQEETEGHPTSKEDEGANAKVPLCTWGAQGTWNMQNCFR